jgi:hypothetical protein
MKQFSRAALAALPESILRKQAIYRETLRVARVRIDAAAVLDDALQVTVTPIATPGLNPHGISQDLAAHGSILFASSRYLLASHLGWQLYLDETVIAHTMKIVSKLGEGTTYQTDYTNTPIQGNAKFKARNTPGPIASALFDFLCGQQMTEVRDFPDMLCPNERIPP